MLTDEEVIDLWNEHMVWGDPKRGGFDDFLSAVRAAVAAERERCARLCETLPIIGRTDQEAFGFSNALETCAAEIRRA